MTREKLDDAYYTCLEIQQIKDLIDSKCDVRKSTIITDMPICHSWEKDKVGNIVVSIDELRGRYLGKLHKAIKLEKEIEDAIEILPPRERMLIRYRYIMGKKWEEIADTMHYCVRYITDIHKGALNKILK